MTVDTRKQSEQARAKEMERRTLHISKSWSHGGWDSGMPGPGGPTTVRRQSEIVSNTEPPSNGSATKCCVSETQITAVYYCARWGAMFLNGLARVFDALTGPQPVRQRAISRQSLADLRSPHVRSPPYLGR